MNTAFNEEAIRIRNAAHLSDVLIAEAVGANAEHRPRLAEPPDLADRNEGSAACRVGEITDRLGRVLDARYIPVWMVKPVEALDDYSPLELIAAGQVRQVARLISGLESPGAA